MLKRIFLFAIIIAASNVSGAGQNDAVSGKVLRVIVYPSGNVLIQTDNQPASHPTCNTSYFAIDANLGDQLINRMMSRALAAHASGETLNIGFDNTSATVCVSGNLKVLRIG